MVELSDEIPGKVGYTHCAHKGAFFLGIIMGYDDGWNLPGFIHCFVRTNIFALIQMVCSLQ